MPLTCLRRHRRRRKRDPVFRGQNARLTLQRAQPNQPIALPAHNAAFDTQIWPTVAVLVVGGLTAKSDYLLRAYTPCLPKNLLSSASTAKDRLLADPLYVTICIGRV